MYGTRMILWLFAKRSADHFCVTVRYKFNYISWKWLSVRRIWRIILSHKATKVNAVVYSYIHTKACCSGSSSTPFNNRRAVHKIINKRWSDGANVCLLCDLWHKLFYSWYIYSICSPVNVQNAIRIYYIWLPSNTPFMWRWLLAADAADAVFCPLLSHRTRRIRMMFNIRMSFMGYVCTYMPLCGWDTLRVFG